MNRKERFEKVLAWFELNMPMAETELQYSSPFGLLVAVILSAQCTDKRVNQITPPLLEKYPTAQFMALATPEEIFEYIRTCSYPNNKANHLVGMAKMVTEKFGGVIPDNIDDLQKLPGVGRKTANVVASVVFNKPAMAVDTHVFRVAARIGLSVNAKNPLQTEEQLVEYIPENLIPKAHHWLILHGRYVCTARKPACEKCGIAPWCNFFLNGSRKSEEG
ncbi:MAG: endonuclease III [Bacteroidales bacterium]|nr:endonuclease III [Bacteroidales bacterium]